MYIYLLIKQHKKTGLKYLCMHTSDSFDDCVRYKGSGVYWEKHLKKHGNLVTTTCVFFTNSKQEFSKLAKHLSMQWDVTKSKQWANLCDEQGQGGDTVVDKKLHGIKSKIGALKPDSYAKLKKHLEKHIKIIQPMAAKAAKEKLTGVTKSEEHKYNMRGKRPHVNQTGNKNNNAKSIETPFGIFGSIREASQQIEGYTYRMIHYQLQKSEEWRYI